MSVAINEDLALSRFCRWAAIEGRSGEEKRIADAIIADLLQAGVPPDCITVDDAHLRSPFKGDIGNVIVTLPGDESLPRKLLSAHMDTVPICCGARPLIEDDQTLGRVIRSEGNTGLGGDDRSGCAAIATAVIERFGLAKTEPTRLLPPAVVVFLVQEEIGLKGAQFLDVTQIGHVDQAFNFDGGTMETIRHGAIGGERIDINVFGHASHAGVAPQKGVSAITVSAFAIADLHRGGWLGLIEKPDGVGTANIGVIEGGEATNVVTPKVTLRAEARSHDQQFRLKIVKAIRRAFEAAAAETIDVRGRCGRVEFESRVDYEAFCLNESHPSVIAATEILRRLGYEPRCEVANGGLDANWLFQHSIEAVTLGCGQAAIHTVDEHLLVDHYLDACRFATEIITRDARSI
ncbi:MAG: M20/M25/M40 family metallo-hydrolase [Planctomycetota bacterium]